ncbi:hypothetical protein Aph01nite_27110 [Acrocarpospora phusangensis]|uniref:Uncharacterized protein n=1 Tax=Acrocarpospora phusangensis TaxID=1070424 RepID=A0A919Q8Z3_9ACTN|nr:hypothetical protein Aph01nite_27110 [Acrocarpospora phusangensis]
MIGIERHGREASALGGRRAQSAAERRADTGSKSILDEGNYWAYVSAMFLEIGARPGAATLSRMEEVRQLGLLVVPQAARAAVLGVSAVPARTGPSDRKRAA